MSPSHGLPEVPKYVGKGVAQLIEARDGVLRLMQEVPLSDEEREVAAGDIEALNRYIEKRRAMPTPAVPNASYIFNPAPLMALRQGFLGEANREVERGHGI
jgi:hypothetical protein